MEVASVANSLQARPNKVSKLAPSFEKHLSPFMMTILFYPLERIQTIHQIKSTFIKQEIRECKQLFTRCTHYGVRTWFRGLSAHLLRVTGVYGFVQLGDLIDKQYSTVSIQDHSDSYKLPVQMDSISDALNLDQMHHSAVPTSHRTGIQIVKLSLIGLAYSFLYPIELVRIRLTAEVEPLKNYQNITECLQKMRKIEGKRLQSLYRGYSIGLFHIISQFHLMQYIYSSLNNNSPLNKLLIIPKQEVQHTVSNFLQALMISELLLYPLDTMKKVVQISGAVGHDSNAYRYRDVFQLGFTIRMLNLAFYYSAIVYAADEDTFQKN